MKKASAKIRRKVKKKFVRMVSQLERSFGSHAKRRPFKSRKTTRKTEE